MNYRHLFVAVLAIPGILLSYEVAKELDRKPAAEPHVAIGDPPYMMAGPTALQEASELGDLERITQLVEQGQDIDERDLAGRTALHYAVGARQAESVSLLLKLGADPDIADEEFRVTPMHWAAGSGNLDIVKLLAPKMKNIDARNEENLTAAEIAYFDDQLEIARLLVAHGSKLNARLD